MQQYDAVKHEWLTNGTLESAENLEISISMLYISNELCHKNNIGSQNGPLMSCAQIMRICKWYIYLYVGHIIRSNN